MKHLLIQRRDERIVRQPHERVKLMNDSFAGARDDRRGKRCSAIPPTAISPQSASASPPKLAQPLASKPADAPAPQPSRPDVACLRPSSARSSPSAGRLASRIPSALARSLHASPHLPLVSLFPRVLRRRGLGTAFVHGRGMDDYFLRGGRTSIRFPARMNMDSVIKSPCAWPEGADRL